MLSIFLFFDTMFKVLLETLILERILTMLYSERIMKS